MTTLWQVKVKCEVCGSSSWQIAVVSYHFLGSLYFDSRPEGINLRCCCQYCPVCNYCAPSIGKSEQVSPINSRISKFDDNGDIENFLSTLENESIVDYGKIKRVANLIQKFLFPSRIEPLTDEFFSKYLDLERFSSSNERNLSYKVDINRIKKILNSEEYKLLLSLVEESYLSEHILYSYICEKFGWFPSAGLYSMCCAWFCDDTFYYQFRKDESQKLRKRAFNFNALLPLP